MQRVLEYVDDHLDDDLDIDRLCQVAAFSRYHFQRQFASLFGISPLRYVQLVRLKRASYRLAYRGGEQIIALALDSGYEGPEAFARAFKRTTGQTPSAFRRQPDWLPWHDAFAPVARVRSDHMTTSFREDMVRIVDFPATRVAAMTHRGDPALIGDTIRAFIAWRKAAGLRPGASATFNILHADPQDCAPEDYRIDLCVATERAPGEPGVRSDMIPGGRCAVLRATGSGDDLRPAASFLYGEWLPQSGKEVRDFPLFAQRVSFFPDVPEHEAVTDLFLPIR
jgi:AraC family transcriptional regulator